VITPADLTGVMCATVTPFAEDGFTVLWDGIRSNAEWLMSQPVSTVVVNGSIGEYVHLSAAERARAVRETADVVRGRAVVVAGCSSDSPAGVVELATEAADSGADAVMLLAPHYFRMTADSVEQFFGYIDARTPLPFILYNNPSVTGYDVPLGTVAAIADLSMFVAYKEASPNPLRFLEASRRLPGRTLVAASESVLYFTLAVDAGACMTASAAFAPALLADLLKAFRESDLPAAKAEFSRLHAFRRLMQPDLDRGLPAYIPYTKAAMTVLGLVGGRPHFPMAQLSGPETAALRTALVDDIGLTPVTG
jgi:dihydrodipicolinate synthase/N-acetylneuraminate lyase